VPSLQGECGLSCSAEGKAGRIRDQSRINPFHGPGQGGLASWLFAMKLPFLVSS